MKTIDFALIGYGGIAKTHLLGMYDANIRQKLPFALRCSGILTRKPLDLPLDLPKNYGSLEQLLLETRPDFLDICTPNDAHLPYAVQGAERGLALYCEKPLAESLESAQRMADLAQKAAIPTAVAFMYRLLPAVNLLKELLEKETVGRIIHFRSAMYHDSYLSPEKAGTWRTDPRSGGGALTDLGSHLIDLVHYVLGDIAAMDADTSIHFAQRSFVDEYAFCNIKMQNGVLGTIECSRISAETDHRDFLEIFGEKGSLKVQMKQPYVVEHYDFASGNTAFLNAPSALLQKLCFPAPRGLLGFHQSAHTASLVSFAQSLQEQKKSAVLADFSDGLKVQRLLDRAYRGR